MDGGFVVSTDVEALPAGEAFEHAVAITTRILRVRVEASRNAAARVRSADASRAAVGGQRALARWGFASGDRGVVLSDAAIDR